MAVGVRRWAAQRIAGLMNASLLSRYWQLTRVLGGEVILEALLYMAVVMLDVVVAATFGLDPGALPDVDHGSLVVVCYVFLPAQGQPQTRPHIQAGDAESANLLQGCWPLLASPRCMMSVQTRSCC
jgi:hypothetical protein